MTFAILIDKERGSLLSFLNVTFLKNIETSGNLKGRRSCPLGYCSTAFVWEPHLAGLVLHLLLPVFPNYTPISRSKYQIIVSNNGAERGIKLYLYPGPG